MSDDVKLSTADLIFCSAMVQPGSTQTSAYLAAYPNFKGMVKTATEEGSRVASRPEIKAKIAELQQKTIIEPAIASAIEAKATITAIMRANPKRLVKQDGTPVPLHELDDEVAIAIVSFKDGEIKMERKLDAAKAVLQFHGDVPPPLAGADGETLEERGSAYDWARRIAFAIQRGKQQRQQQLVEGSTDEH